MRYYKNDYHENKMINYNTCITISTRSRRSYLSIWSIYYPTMAFINVIFWFSKVWCWYDSLFVNITNCCTSYNKVISTNKLNCIIKSRTKLILLDGYKLLWYLRIQYKRTTLLIEAYCLLKINYTRNLIRRVFCNIFF